MVIGLVSFRQVASVMPQAKRVANLMGDCLPHIPASGDISTSSSSSSSSGTMSILAAVAGADNRKVCRGVCAGSGIASCEHITVCSKLVSGSCLMQLVVVIHILASRCPLLVESV
jgi:hypothetical protein